MTPYKNNHSCYNHSQEVIIKYLEFGNGQRPIIFLHGFGASTESWKDIVSFFSLKDYRLFLIDLKGFGASSKPKDGVYTLKEQAVILIGFMESLSLQDVILVGHSYGGGVALLTKVMQVKEKNAVNIQKLILIDCAAYLEHLPFFLKYLRIPIFNHLIWNLFSARFRAQYTLRKLFFDSRKVTLERIDRYAIYFRDHKSEYSFIKAAQQIIPDDYKELIAAYALIDIPTQIIWGREDPALPLAHGKKLHTSIKGSKLTVIDNCGHIPQEEQPGITFYEIQAFLQENNCG